MNGFAVCAECRESVPRHNTIQYGDVFICAACKPKFVQRLREGAAMPGEETGLVHAGFWIRFWASVIDGILFMVITWPILISVYGWKYFDAGFIAGPIDLLISWILPAIGTLAFWISKQATPGKILLQVKIVDVCSGGAPSVAQLFIRYVMYFVSLLPFGLGYIWVAFDKRKQGWHDKAASTIVIRTSKHE